MTNHTEAVVSNEVAKKTPIEVIIRWLIRRDMPEVLQIEQASFASAWSEEDFLCCLRQRNCIGLVAEYENSIVGFVIFALHKSRLDVLSLAVDPEFRRRGVGRQMIIRLIDKLSQQRRNEIRLEVRERNLPAQVFFRQHGFRANEVIREHYEDTNEDGYVMQYLLPAEPSTPSGNRISAYYE